MEITNAGTFPASFDLTDFGTADAFREVLDACGLEENDAYSGDGFEWVSSDGNLALHTYNHPITGERACIPQSGTETGYASYIHLLGDVDSVRQAYNEIQANAEYVKGQTLGEWGV